MMWIYECILAVYFNLMADFDIVCIALLRRGTKANAG